LRPRFTKRRLEARVELVDDGLPQALLRAEVVVDEGLGDFGAAGDVAHARAGKTDFGKRLCGRAQQTVTPWVWR
jgi:hypothetical protein